MRSAKFSKIVIFTVCILLVFAVAAALLFDGASLPASGNVIADSGEGADRNLGEYPAVNYGYQHGTNIDRSTSGASAVSNETALRNALNGSGSYYLTQDITLSASNSFDMSNTFSGTLYGNGHTVTVTGNKSNSTDLQTGIANATNIGGLVSKLSGKIYDLNVVLKSGTSAAYKSASSEIRLGLIAGVIDGGTIENCTVTISSGSNLVALSASAGSISTGANTGGVAGNCNGSMTIKNVTVINNGTIAGAVQDSGSATATNYRYGSGNAAMFVGFIWNDKTSYTQTMNNIIAKGGGTIDGYVSSILGTTYTTTLALTVNNYYNQYTGGFNYGSTGGWSSVSLVSYTLFKWSGSSDSSKVVNYYHSSGTNQSMMSSGYFAVPDNSITVSATDYTVYFDPRQEDLSNSLAVVKTGVTGGQNYTASITTNSGTTYSDRYSFSDDGGTVIFRRLPMAISNWGGNNGTFACTINITQNAVEVTPLPAVNKWESSYTTSQSSSGTAVDNGSKLTTAIKNNDQNIYLTSDITDFKGFTHTGEYTGTLDGNGHTIYIVRGASDSEATVGGLFKRLSGTIKNVRIVLYSSYNRTISVGSIGTGIIAGNLCGGTVDNVYVYVPSDVTFGANGGSNYESYVGAVAGLSDAGYTINNTTVDIDGEIRLDGSYVYLAGFVGKSQSAATRYNYNFTNVTLRGSGTFDSDYSASSEPVFMGASTILFTPNGVNGSAMLNIDGFINDFQGSIAAQNYSMYGILTQNQKTGTLAGWTINTANVYDYDTPLADINKTATGNKYIEITSRSTVSTTAEGSSIKVTPYFPAGDTENLVLVAGDGTSECPFVTYESYEGVKDGNYMVVSISKTEITAHSNVQLTQGKSPVNEPTLATTEEELVYNGGEITIAINQLTSGTTALGEGDYTLTVTAKDGGTGSVQNNKPVNAGDYTLTVTLLNDYEFADGTTKKTLEFTVTPFEISGTLSISTSAVYDKTEKTVIFTADDGKELFGGDNVVISYNGGDRINVTEAGFTATATVPNANYTFVNSASSIEETFKITAKELSVVWGETSFTYDRSEKVPTAKVTEGIIEGDSVTLSVSGAVAAAGQDYTATATISPENVNYSLTNNTVQFSIAKAKVSVSGNNATAEYKAAEYTEAEIKAAVFTNGLPDDATTNIAVSPESVINAGASATVTVTLKDGNNYEFEAGATTQFTFTVVAKEISLPEASADKTAVYNPSTSYTAAQITELIFGTASVENVTVKVMKGDVEISGDTSVSDAGVYNVTATANENYVFVADTVTQYTFEITKAPITLDVTVDGWTYGEAANLPTVGGNEGEGVVTYLYTGDGYSDSEAPTNAGTYKVTATVAETTNYRGATAEKEFTIAKKAIAATVSAQDADYNGKPHEASVTFEGKLTDDELTANLLYNGEAEAPVNAGSYTVTVQSYGGAAVDNYDITTSEREVVLKISPKELNYGDFDVLPEDENFDGVYDGKPHGVVATIKDGVLIGDDTLTVTVLYNGSEEKPVNAGEYEISLKISGNDNYMLGTDNTAELEIYKATVNISGSNATAVYTGEAFEDNEIIKAVFGDADLSLVEVNISYGESAAAQYAGDKATLTLTLKDGNNYEFAAETVTTYTFTVTAGTVSLSGENATVEYRGTAYTEAEIKNAVFGEGTWEKFVITISYNNTEALNAGDIATVTVTGYSDPNYSLDPEMTKEYTFTVETFKVAAPQLTADSFVYNGEAQTVSLTDDAYVDISANVQTDKGDYNAVAALKDKANYEWTAGGSADIELPWSISAKDITLKAEASVDKTYDGKEYDFRGYVVSGADGFYDRDNVAVTVSAGDIYVPGSYGITVSHDENGNYNVTVEPTDAKLTINQATLTVTAKDAEIEYTGNIITFEFDITAGKVGEDDVQIDGVTYKQNGVAVAPQETGTYDVTFTLKGANAAYYTANATQVKVTPQTATAPEGMTSDSIVLPADDDMIYDGEAHVAILDYTATDGNTYGIIYHNGTSYVDEAVNAGEYTVHVYKNTKTNIVEGISKTMTVKKKILLSDDIGFTSGGSLSFTYSGDENKVTAIATGVKGEDVALTTLYDGGDKAPVDAGEYTVTFASANGNYAVDERVSCKMTVAKANVNAPKANELVYNGTEQSAFSENSLYTAGGVIAATDVSEEGYTATFTLMSDNYKWSNKGDEVRGISVIWNIAPASRTIAVSDAEKEKVYDGAALTPEELAALFVAPDKIGGGKVEIVVTVKDGGEVLNVGVYTVTAKLKDRNYVADKAETTFTVTQATPKVTVKVQDKLLQEGDKLSTVGIYLEEGSTPGTVSWEDTELALKKGENVVAWTYVPEDTLNYKGATGSLTLTVGDEVLTAFEMTKGPDKTEYTAFEAFDPTGIELMATFDGVHEQEVAIDECEIVVENAAADGKLTAATTKVTVKYGNMSVEIAVSVAKIKVEIPALEQTEFEYTAQPHTVTVAEDPRYAIVEGNEGINVGKYNAVVSLTDKVNYEWADGLAEDRKLSWEITPVTLSGYITLPENLVYDGAAKVATFTLTKGELLGGATMNIAYELTDGTVLQGAPVDAGVYEVVATLPDTKNYRFEEGTEYCKAMTVEKKTVTIITIGSREKVYDGSEVTSEQLAEHFSATDGITVKVTASGTVLNAGTYQITATIEEKNYRAEPVSCTYTVRKASQTAKADISVGYLKVEITAADETAIVEYSEDGNVWKTLDGAITVGLKATYTYYVRYAESANYNASAAVKVEGNITKAALMQYVEERFTGDITLADAADVAKLEELAKSAEGQNADFDKALESLSAQREELVNGATNAVEKALKAGGALKGYAAVATALAITVGGISAAAAVGLMIGKGKGGKKNEEK